MSRIDRSEFPCLGAGSSSSEKKQSASAWSRPPKIPRKKSKISRQAELGGAWLTRWEAYGGHFFALTTCGWIIDVIDRPITTNRNKEAQTFYHWFLEKVEQDGLDQRLLDVFNNTLHIYVPKIAVVLREFREDSVETEDDVAFKAHWFITLDHYQWSMASFDSALRMIKEGRRDIQQMTEELWTPLDQNGSGKMKEALQTIISWYQ
jgi:hypothetical protein